MNRPDSSPNPGAAADSRGGDKSRSDQSVTPTEVPAGAGEGGAASWHLYADIIDLPPHVSTSHPRMSRRERAGQFAAFAALDGFKQVVTDTSRENA